MYSLFIKLKPFAAAHRIIGDYTGKCNNLHGHNYQVNIAVSSTQLNSSFMVYDFADIKTKCNNWINDNFDHGVLVYAKDTVLLDFLIGQKQKIYTFSANTTAEILSKELFEQFSKILPKEVTLDSVEVFETETSSCKYLPS